MKLITSLLVIVSGLFYYLMVLKSNAHPLSEQAPPFVVAQSNHLIDFNLVDPEQAPPEIRESVLRGYHLMINTAKYAPQYALDQLSCTNCHFSAGDTLGGKNNGISLVGVTTRYPIYSSRENQVISLIDRINACFERSLNGNPLPVDSQEMRDIVAYLNWISVEVEQIKPIPWLGMSMLDKKREPNPKKGKMLYQIHCTICHKENGEGGGPLPTSPKTIPPIWGSHSFNDGAGMSRLQVLASFIYWNMPYNQANLNEEEAWDIAAFILQQPRPHFNPKGV
jgi:thiosulfate dehydrogenase